MDLIFMFFPLTKDFGNPVSIPVLLYVVMMGI